ncbi:hypothetical protein FSP39_001692 [Pinctada imbricata]|uniref:Mab-21-like HhH/H2TH-like domain-containing protein n=1 Tax=Pinctada imbricata TaxID=66713 RepID=A0AA88YT68_PINIB|nr:hypothetical protein FSP39_001692 [Pinctada imbricata]
MLKDSVTVINSGSRAEGFDFITSDFDIMLTTPRVKVLPSLPPGIDTQSDIVLLMEKENTRPGFVRLFATQDPGILMFLFSNLGNKYYLSNSLLKHFALDVSRMDITNISLHGPCLSSEYEMTDLALTLSSNSWSNDAIGCVHRMLKRGWPPGHIVQEMVKDGVLFVPIGCRFSQHEDVEWRMSFSLAEKRLVHSMNHTQFLVYALLKLFLKGVVEQNAEVKGLMCSYFMKTSVFWEIMEAKTPWIPSNLLLHFWNCFRRLLNWVKSGYCPNFFIPENNMFFGKIHGDAQQKLMKYLGSLHAEGHGIIKKIPILMFEFDKWTGVPNHGISHGLKRSQVILDLTTTFSFGCGRSAETLLQALGSEKSKIVSECCQFLRLSEINLSCNRKLFEQSTLDDCNKVKYMKERSIIRVLMLSSPDCIRSRMFLAMYFYKCKRYDRTLRLLYAVLQKYEDPETFNTFPFNQIGFDTVGGEVLSIPEGMRRHSICQIPFESTTCISEIFDEFSYSNIAHECQVVPPLPLVHFVLFLCHFQMEDLAQARIHLMELENHNNHRMEEYLELLDLRRTWRLSKEAISWELLGVGHEVIGDFRDALKYLRICNKILLSNRVVSAINLRLFEANKRRIKRIEEILEKS